LGAIGFDGGAAPGQYRVSDKVVSCGRIMDEKYWDKVAEDYDGEIFSVPANDRNNTIVWVDRAIWQA